MFVFRTDLELAFMSQSQLLDYMRASEVERCRNMNRSGFDYETREYILALQATEREAGLYCDHTGADGCSLIREGLSRYGIVAPGEDGCLVCAACQRFVSLLPVAV